MVYEMNDKKCCDHIKGVCCDVKNCAYHDGETRCTAGEITVGPTYASTSGYRLRHLQAQYGHEAGLTVSHPANIV